MPDMQITHVAVASLQPMPGNPRRNDEAIPKVADSIKRFGWTNPILARREDNVVVAGHTRPEAARRLGIDKVPVIFLDLSPTDARLYNLADNKLSQISEWDAGPLAEMLEELQAEDLAGLHIAGFEDDEIARLLAEVSGTPEGLTDPDDVPEEPAQVYVQVGQTYRLGKHLLTCGDSTRAEVIDAAMGGDTASICWTDPPWNVAYESAGRRGKANQHEAIANDNLGEDFPQFLALACAEMRRVLRPGGIAYVAMSTQEMPTLHSALVKLGFNWSSTIIWAKDQQGFGRKDYHPKYEPIWYGWRDDAPRLHPLVDRTQSDLWEIPRPKRSDEHPTMKPIELITRALENSSTPGDVVYEPFSGSGSTIIACEKTGRRCRAIELVPAYVQVAITRWEEFTGKKAELVE